MKAQEIVNNLYQQYGPGLPFRVDYHSLLSTLGLKPSEVTREVLDTAEQATRKHLLGNFRELAKPRDDSTIDPVTNIPSLENDTVTTETTTRVRTMRVAEEDARTLLQNCGNKKALTFTLEQLGTKLNDIASWIDKVKDPSEQDLVLLRNIGDAVQEGEEIVVAASSKEAEPETDDQETTQEEPAVTTTTAEAPKRKRGRPRKEETAENNGHTKNGHKAKPKERVSKKTSPVELAGTDKFGSRLNSDLARINAAIGRKPKKMKDLVAEAGLSGTFYDHLNRLVEKRLVEKTDKGYVVAK